MGAKSRQADSPYKIQIHPLNAGILNRMAPRRPRRLPCRRNQRWRTSGARLFQVNTSLLVFIHVLIVCQVNRHTTRKNLDPHLQNLPISRMPTIISRTPAILLTLGVNDIDGTGRLPEFASRWLFHAPFSSIRGSPGSFAVFFILGDFVVYTVLFVSLLYLYAGISHLQHSPSYSRDIGVLQLLLLRVG